MVSYNNFLPYPQKPNPANIPYPASQPWQWTANYHTPPNHQYIGEMDTPHAAHHQMYYNPHPMFHSATNAAAAAASDWHSPSSAESFAQNAQIYQHQLINGSAFASGTIISSTPSSSSTSSSSTTSAGPASGGTHLNESVTSVIGEQQQHQHQIQQQQQQQQQQQPLHLTEGLPSPPITVSGSEISSPGAPASSFSPHHIAAHNLGTNNHSPKSNNNNNHNSNSTPKHKNNRASPIRAHPYFEWMKKSSHPAQPAPGKTRTKDKYRVVYTDFQRLELEKEYCTTRYITIRRKTELALMLTLSERQVKIWFQNRRAKERKQHKKVNEPSLSGVQPKLEPGLQLQHSLHPMNPMAMGMPTMRLHPHLHAHSLAVSAAQSHQLPHPQISAAAAAVANNMPSLPM